MHVTSRLSLVLALLLAPSLTLGQFLSSPQPGDIYREFTQVMATSGNNWRVTDLNASHSGAQVFKPNPLLNITISDLQQAIRAEAIIEVWGGHTGTIGKQLRFNNNPWINIPELGTANGIPVGKKGECYQQQPNYVLPVPLSHILQGSNTFQGNSGGQTCFNFNWGQWGWYQLMVRVYYDPSKPHNNGTITSPASGTTLSENPTIAVAAGSGPTITQVDFLANYDGPDFDGDGLFSGYKFSYHRLKNESQMLLKNHVGTDNTAPFQLTWNTSLVPDQIPGNIKLKALIKSDNGVVYVSNEVQNLTLQRTGSVKMYTTIASVPERFWIRSGRTLQSVTFNIPAGHILSQATSATVLIPSWNANDPTDSSQVTRINGLTIPRYGVDHFYSFDAVTISPSVLQSGNNTFSVFSSTTHHGPEILWPGPMVIVRYSGTGGSTPASVAAHPQNQVVMLGHPASFTVSANGTSPIQYQWQKNGLTIPGANAATLTIAATSMADSNAQFRCIINNPYGGDTSNSARISLLYSSPLITSHPASHTTYAGSSATFSVTVTGALPMAYQWQRNGIHLPGQTQSSLSIPSVTSADSADHFRCIVSNQFGTDSSNTAILVVLAQPPQGVNVVTNPGFESGTTSWTFFTDATGTLSSQSPGFTGTNSGRLTITTGGANVQLYQQGIPLEPNAEYTLSFAAYCNTGHDVALFLQKHGSPFTNYGLNNVVVDLGTSWQTYTVEFTTSGFLSPVTDGRLRFWLAPYDEGGDIYYFDDISLSRTPTTTSIDGSRDHSPQQFVLQQNYPNPFNPSTQLEYTIPSGGHVQLRLFTSVGNEVRTLVNEVQTAGTYRIRFDAAELASGTYFYRLVHDRSSKVRAMTLLK